MSDEATGWTRRQAMRLGLAAGLGISAGGLLVPRAYADEPKRGGSIRAANYTSSTKDTLDPAHANNSTDYARLFMFYNGLTVFDEQLNPLPDLATSVESSDAKVWTVKLRKGVTFHDGSPFTADDVVFSLERHKDPKNSSVVAPIAGQFEEIKATAPDEVRITLSAPNSELPTILAIYQFVIVKNGTTDFNKGIGTGPFLCKEFSPGVRSVGVRNPNYFHSGKPYLDQVTFLGIPDNAARVNALLSGDIDLAGAINPHSTRDVKAAKGFEIFESKSGNYTDLIMHLRCAGHRQSRLRHGDEVPAGSREDQEQRVSGLRRDRQRPADRPDQSVLRSRARAACVRSGQGEVPSEESRNISGARLVCSPAPTGSVDMAVILQNAAQGIGFNLELQRVPADGFWSNYWLKSPFTYGNINPRPSANILLSLFFQSTAPWNESHWKNEKFDKLLVDARAQTDVTKRKAMYADMQRMINEEAGIGIPVFISGIDAHTSRLKGLRAIPTGGMMGFNFAQNVWLDG